MSNNFLEHQAYEISEEIRKQSLYKWVGLEVSGNDGMGIKKKNTQWNGNELITKVILEDKNGTSFSINPDQNGLRFAKGEITYKEYCKLQKKADVQGYSYFFGIIGFFIIMMFTLTRLII
ncbi:hypothetical protein R4Z10_09630 [Niallia sp. XMNu-256]|uniref:hypothetical protein n=1 Tax=Niallia sp. XMNu-256 TaxID=3082444 RepID=UPI0030D0B317